MDSNKSYFPSHYSPIQVSCGDAEVPKKWMNFSRNLSMSAVRNPRFGKKISSDHFPEPLSAFFAGLQPFNSVTLHIIYF
jgi:hypothetical protein